MAEQPTLTSFWRKPVANSVPSATTAPASSANVKMAAATKKLATPAAATKPLATPTAAKRTKRTKLPATRLQCVGAGQLEKKIEALRSKLPQNAHIVVYSLCWRLQCGSADE